MVRVGRCYARAAQNLLIFDLRSIHLHYVVGKLPENFSKQRPVIIEHLLKYQYDLHERGELKITMEFRIYSRDFLCTVCSDEEIFLYFIDSILKLCRFSSHSSSSSSKTPIKLSVRNREIIQLKYTVVLNENEYLAYLLLIHLWPRWPPRPGDVHRSTVYVYVCEMLRNSMPKRTVARLI